MSKKISLGTALALALLFGMVVAVMTLIFFMNRQDASLRNLQGRANLYGKLEEIDKYVRDNYFGEISEQALNDYLARGYMAGIEDPYAMYHRRPIPAGYVQLRRSDGQHRHRS